MIQIEINRWTIMKLEESIDKYNREHHYHVYDYSDLINRLLEEYLKQESLLPAKKPAKAKD